ncbi:Ankyrin repeat-containing protein [Glarea lozoyensis ATCC 20868]|uniref:Ankyrin repeat-containing protein n=1 Tax=Glarea lozoyensis (strain ATCC 20868 / MF5171) TaxID=1116229 RepID=S3DJZ2_GLAL2|nr:Ankyrin repeat-containing protein [Glarea lozoyensis ATCC 20868]EPE32366.1 Ankyrin repeat-containing protein [Glarea lozoyensis ATCC 20868]
MEEPKKFAIHEAARDGKNLVVESLLAANPKLAFQRDDDDRLAIHWAVSYGHLNIAVLLSGVKNFDPDVQDGSGWTPLMIAVSLKEGDDLVDLFLRKGADVNAKNNSSQTALHFTASKLNLPAAKKLLSASPPASTRVKDIRGQYPIHRAAAIGSVPLVQLFLANESPLDATDVSGQTPLHHAIAEGHGDTAVALLKAGAATDKKDSEGFLALDLAPDSQVKKFILQEMEREGIEL